MAFDTDRDGEVERLKCQVFNDGALQDPPVWTRDQNTPRMISTRVYPYGRDVNGVASKPEEVESALTDLPCSPTGALQSA